MELLRQIFGLTKKDRLLIRVFIPDDPDDPEGKNERSNLDILEIANNEGISGGLAALRRVTSGAGNRQR